MFELPAVSPLTTPVDAPIVATAVLLLAHVPPATAQLSVVVVPVHNVVLPVIAGRAVTLTVVDLPQPVGSI